MSGAWPNMPRCEKHQNLYLQLRCPMCVGNIARERERLRGELDDLKRYVAALEERIDYRLGTGCLVSLQSDVEEQLRAKQP